MSKTVEEVRAAQRARGPAMVLAIGTATSAHVVYQTVYPEYYSRITKSEHTTELENKLQHIFSVLFKYSSNFWLEFYPLLLSWFGSISS